MSIQTPKNRFLRLCTAEQSRQLDHNTIHSFGIDGSILMEIAGLKAADVIRNYVPDDSHGLYVCGKGNNAGDAFVIARYLSEQPGHAVTIYLAAGDDGLSPDAEKNLNLLKKLAEQNDDILIVKPSGTEPFKRANFNYIIDGLIGTGLTSDVREPLASCVNSINSSTATVFALDIPTGLSCDTGQVLGCCVEADRTITFGTNKVGFYLDQGPEMCGKVHLAELPFPEHLRKTRAVLLQPGLTKELSLASQKADHKYQKGTVHIIAGSEGITGAAIMTAKSAWKAGAGAVILYTPRGLLSIYEQTLPEIIKIPVGSYDDRSYKTGHIKTILGNIRQKPGVVLAGPGIGRSEETKHFVKQILGNLKEPVVLDADGLYGWNTFNKIDKSGWVVTPHIGELKQAMGLSFTTDSERLNETERLAASEECIILSKGYPAILATPNSGSFITGYDTRIFSKAGFGDVLAGTIAGYLTVSKLKTESIIGAMLHIFETANFSDHPEPRDIYGR